MLPFLIALVHQPFLFRTLGLGLSTPFLGRIMGNFKGCVSNSSKFMPAKFSDLQRASSDSMYGAFESQFPYFLTTM